MPSSAGIRICADLAWRDCPPESLDTLLVPGGLGVEAQTRNADLLAWLKAAEPCIRRLGSVFGSADPGRRRGSRRAPGDHPLGRRGDAAPGVSGVHVQGDRLHTYDPRCRDGDAHIFTSAGVTAGIDLAGAGRGRPRPQPGAQRRATPGDVPQASWRPGQFSAWLTPEPSRTPRLAALLEWIPANLAGDLSLEALADQACMSPRTLSRVFLQELGVAPGRYVERVRLEAARALLRTPRRRSPRCPGCAASAIRKTSGGRSQASFGQPQEYAERFGMLT